MASAVPDHSRCAHAFHEFSKHLMPTSTPHRLAATILRTFVDAAEGVPVARAVKWAIMSTANINRKVIPAAHASPKVELVGVASRDQARGRIREDVGDPARVWLL
jgi:hypothetical protein